MKGMAVRGVIACVPPREISNERDYPWFDATEIRKITAMAGIQSRRQTEPDTCTSDLCFAAAKRLLRQLDWVIRVKDFTLEPFTVYCAEPADNPGSPLG